MSKEENEGHTKMGDRFIVFYQVMLWNKEREKERFTFFSNQTEKARKEVKWNLLDLIIFSYKNVNIFMMFTDYIWCLNRIFL